MDTKVEVEEGGRRSSSRRWRVTGGLLLCTGDMEHLDKFMQGRKTLAVHGCIPTCFIHFDRSIQRIYLSLLNINIPVSCLWYRMVSVGYHDIYGTCRIEVLLLVS